MRIAIASDENVGIARVLALALARRGHEVRGHGALALAAARQGGMGQRAGRHAGDGQAGADGALGEPGPAAARNMGDGARAEQWAWASAAAARDVAEGRAERAVVCCWTGTGASIAANKITGVRAALCRDAATAEGARRWNDANVLAISLRSTSEAELEEILDAFLATVPSGRPDDRANVEHVRALETAGPKGPA